MVRSVIAEENSLQYLLDFAQPDRYSIGLILGQTTGNRDYVIHLARTPSLAVKGVEEEGSPENSDAEETPVTIPLIRKIKDINDSWVADHAKHVTRMLPGGVWVLGIFIVGPDDIFADPTTLTRVKSILGKVSKTLAANQYLHGNGPSPEKLIFYLNSNSHKYACKSVEADKLSSVVNPADWKFQPSPTKWHQLDCHYDFDQIYPITSDRGTQSLKAHLTDILSRVNESVEKAICMIDGELKESTELLDAVSKKKKGKAAVKEKQETKKMIVNLYVPCDSGEANKELQINECSGQMNFLGILASRVFLHQKATVEEAVKAVKQDVVRSLASRLEMHWDSLIEEEDGSSEEHLVLHEPPRRVLVPLPHCPVTLSDYLFPGEGPSEALISLQELLDLKVNEDDVLKDLEIQADASEYCSPEIEGALETESSDDLLPASSNPYPLIRVCLAFTLFMLIASIVVQYLRDN